MDKSKSAKGVQEVIRKVLRFPTPNAILNLGITATVVYILAYLFLKKEYESYWITIIYTAIYLVLIALFLPKLVSS